MEYNENEIKRETKKALGKICKKFSRKNQQRKAKKIYESVGNKMENERAKYEK